MSTRTISKEFAFSASHQLDGLDPEHPCSRLHGHNYVVRLTLIGEPDEVGFVYDYRRLDPFKAYLDDTLDHRHLNEVLDFNPTAENMAGHFAEQAIDRLDFPANVFTIRVAISETPKTWAEAETRAHRHIERNL
jgi:6-pyruvoyltetrahydropterin/6-carboxytetrahydropterin synthase